MLVERLGREGFAVASADGVTVALDTALDDELILEGRVRDLVREVNTMRKEQGLEAHGPRRADRAGQARAAPPLEGHIENEVLAVEIRVDGERQALDREGLRGSHTMSGCVAGPHSAARCRVLASHSPIAPGSTNVIM